MKLDFNLQVSQKQGLTITTQVQQAIKLLQMNNLELSEFVEEQFQDNPFIEEAIFSEKKLQKEPKKRDKDLDHSFETNPYKSTADETKISQELEGLKKLKKEGSPELTTRLKHMITSVNGETDSKTIREFVDTSFLARDARAFREHVQKIQPDVDLTFFPSTSNKSTSLPIGINFFWPDANLG